MIAFRSGQPPARPPVQQAGAEREGPGAQGGEALLQPVQGQGLGLDAGDALQGEHHGQVHQEQGRQPQGPTAPGLPQQQGRQREIARPARVMRGRNQPRSTANPQLRRAAMP